jgi:hypothetical protein
MHLSAPGFEAIFYDVLEGVLARARIASRTVVAKRGMIAGIAKEQVVHRGGLRRVVSAFDAEESSEVPVVSHAIHGMQNNSSVYRSARETLTTKDASLRRLDTQVLG